MFTWLRRLLCLSPPQHTADTPNHQRPTNPPAINNPGQGLEADRRNDESNLNAVLQNSISVYVETTAVGLVNASGNDSSPEPVKEVIVDVPASAEDTHTDDDTGRQRLANLLKGTGKTVLTLVDSVSDALPPLKSVASGIKVIVEIAERVGENDVDLNNLSERITEIRRLIAARPDADAQHEGRVVLERTLENISKVLDPLRQQSTLERVLTAPDIAARIHEYLAKVEQALVDYQVSLTQSLHDMGRRQLPLVEEVHAMNAQQLTYDELHLLDKLARVKDAGFNGSDERSRCLEGTRVDILRSIKAWASDPNEKQIYWLNGHAGSGKSTIAQSIAQSLFEEDRLGASFFCSRESQQRGNYKLIFPTLAFQLACSRSPRSTLYKEEMLRVLKKSPDIASQALKDQLAELFVKPVKQSKIEAVIVVDALDECRDDNSVSLVLSFLADVVSSIPSIKFFITSRPEPHIRAGFGLQGLRPVSDVVVLHEVGSASVDHDIRLFLRTEFRELAIRRNDIMDPTIDWPEEAHVEELVSRASGLFIYASTIVKFIDRQGRNPRKQLALVLQCESTRNGLSALDTLYLGILHGAFPYIDEDCFPELPLVLGFLAVACDSLSCAAIAELLGVDAFDVRTILNLLQSVIHVPDNVAHPVRFFHKSFPDFLTSQTRCTDERFLVKADELQYEVTIHCFRLLRHNLKKNICGLPRYSVNDSLPATRRDACITEATRYACRFWADHLLSDPNRRARITTSDSELRSSLQHFATTQQLWWFEVLALLHELRRSVESLDHVYSWLITCGDQCQTLVRWIHEGQRFILQSFNAVQVSVAHIYHSALLFSPRNALLRKHHSDDLQDEAEAILGVDDVWSAEARTIRGRYTYNILEYSHDGTMLAACVTGIWGYCHVFRASTGERLASFARPNQTNSEVSSISFSINDEILAMASGSGVLLWNMTTGAMVTELRPQDGIPIRTITFHPYNANLLLSLDIRGCVRSWNMKTYECDAQFSCDVEDLPVSVRGTMSWLRRPTRSIVLLPSNLGRVELWDVETGMRTKVLTPDGLPNMTKPPREIVSSCDGSIIAANTDEFIGFWDTDSGHLRFQIICPQEKGPFVKSMQFSPTNPMLIALTCATSVFLMNPLKQIKAPEKGSRKLGQSNNAAHSIFATFSPDGRFIASAFEDAHITFWDLNSDDTDAAEVHNPDDHEGSISSAHFSPDGLHIVTASSDKTVKVWNAVDGTLCTTLRGFSSKICNAIFLPDDTYIVSSDEQNHLMIWDWREGDKRWDLDLGIPMGAMGTCDVLFPFAHNGTFGFFSARRYAFETQNIRCWIVTPREDEDGDEDGNEDEDGDEDEGGLGCIYLAAKGLTASGPIGDVTIFGEDYVTSIKYEAPDPSNPLALVLTAECKSGRVFKTLWNFPAMTPDSPPILQELDWTRVAEADGSTIIIEDRRDIEPVGLSNILWQQLFYTTYLEGERPFLKSKNENWVLNERNEKILWIPAKNRGRFGRWYGDKLVLEGTSGRLTLLDFSRAKLSSRDPF